MVNKVVNRKPNKNLFGRDKSMAGKQKYELFDGSSKIFSVGTDPRGKVDLFNLKRITTWAPDGTPHVLEFEDRFEVTDGKFATFGVLPHIRKAVEQDLRNANISCEYTGFKKGQKTSNSLSFDVVVLKIKVSDKEFVNELLRKYD